MSSDERKFVNLKENVSFSNIQQATKPSERVEKSGSFANIQQATNNSQPSPSPQTQGPAEKK